MILEISPHALFLTLALAGCPGDDTGGNATGSTTGTPDDTTTTSTTPPGNTSSNASTTTTSPGTSSSSGSDPDSSTTVEGSSTTSGSSGSSSGGMAGAPVTVEWTEFMVINDCFLFNDPDVLGPDAQWLDEAGAISLVFDAVPDNAYDGLLDMNDLILQSVATPDFAGETWQFTETMTGTIVDGHYVGQWTYSECNMTAAPRTCPDDQFCGGTANFDVTLPR